MDFFQTKMGRQFIDGTMPRIAKALERIAARMDADAEESSAPIGMDVAAAHKGEVRGTVADLVGAVMDNPSGLPKRSRNLIAHALVNLGSLPPLVVGHPGTAKTGAVLEAFNRAADAEVEKDIPDYLQDIGADPMCAKCFRPMGEDDKSEDNPAVCVPCDGDEDEDECANPRCTNLRKKLRTVKADSYEAGKIVGRSENGERDHDPACHVYQLGPCNCD